MGFCAVEAVGTKKESWKALFSASIISIGFKNSDFANWKNPKDSGRKYCFAV